MLEIRIESNVSGIFTGIFSAPIWCKFISRDFRLKRRVYRAFSGLLQFVFHGFRFKKLFVLTYDIFCGICLFRERTGEQHEYHTRSVLRTHIALRNEHFNYARIPEAESSRGQERGFVKGNPLQRAKGTVSKTHRIRDRHILYLRTGYVHRRIPIWHKADD